MKLVTMIEPSFRPSSVRSAIFRHVQEFWANSKIFENEWQEGPIQESLPGFKVLTVSPETPQQPIIYVTNGCFLGEPDEHIRHEFFLLARMEQSQHVETLTMLANFHADGRYRLDVGSVVNIGRPWISDSKCDHLLISIPYPYGPKLEWLTVSSACIRFLWALPITSREAAFVELNGSEAMEQKFDAVKLDYLNPHRSSVV
jgi:hypothetical protein